MKKNTKTGFISLIIMIVMALIILGVFGFNIKNILSAPLVKENLNYIWDLFVNGFTDFIYNPALVVVSTIIDWFVSIWKSFLNLF